ncbi:MAG: outer membrane beta-barrel protein, partial [Rhodospirillales bacterium]|nr:outer membrane beta-barrel protein [Rhodospirillales bacterium]
GVGAKYLFNRNFIASLGYTYNVKESTSSGSGYKQHTALLTLRGQF